MIQTGYFAKFKGDNGVAICLYPPKYFKGETYPSLAPTKRILEWYKSTPQDEKSQRIYKKLYYRDVLNHLDVHAVARALDGKVLLCYERPDDFCHRHIVAEWLNANGYKCQEAETISEQELYKFYGKLYELFGDDLIIDTNE